MTTLTAHSPALPPSFDESGATLRGPRERATTGLVEIRGVHKS